MQAIEVSEQGAVHLVMISQIHMFYCPPIPATRLIDCWGLTALLTSEVISGCSSGALFFDGFRYDPAGHLRSPRLLCVRSLGSPWYNYVYFNSASSGIQWVVSLLQWLTKLGVLNVSHYATMNNKTSVKHNWRCFKSWSVIGRIESVRVQSD